MYMQPTPSHISKLMDQKTMTCCLEQFMKQRRQKKLDIASINLKDNGDDAEDDDDDDDDVDPDYDDDDDYDDG